MEGGNDENLCPVEGENDVNETDLLNGDFHDTRALSIDTLSCAPDGGVDGEVGDDVYSFVGMGPNCFCSWRSVLGLEYMQTFDSGNDDGNNDDVELDPDACEDDCVKDAAS
jgi:hypothetical protein